MIIGFRFFRVYFWELFFFPILLMIFSKKEAFDIDTMLRFYEQMSLLMTKSEL